MLSFLAVSHLSMSVSSHLKTLGETLIGSGKLCSLLRNECRAPLVMPSLADTSVGFSKFIV